MNESTDPNSVEAKWVRLQAALDEFGDTLSIRLRTIREKLMDGETHDALELIEEMIVAVEVFSGPTEAEEGDEAGDS